MNLVKKAKSWNDIDEIKIHQCFCPFHHLNDIFLMFHLLGLVRLFNSLDRVSIHVV